MQNNLLGKEVFLLEPGWRLEMSSFLHHDHDLKLLLSKPTIFVTTDTTEMSRLLVTSITFSRLKDVQLPVKHVEMLKQSLELWSLAWQPPLL